MMDRTYADDRTTRPELIFRLKYRALSACNAYRRWLPGRNNPRLLDLGAAEGATLREVHIGLNAKLSVGIEFSQDLIQAAVPLPNGCELRQGDVNDLSQVVGGETFDVVMALAVLEHLPNPGQVMAGVQQVLRPGGLFIATSPAGTWDHISGHLGLHREEYHETVICRRVFHTLARGAGLEFLEFRRFMWAPLAILPYFRLRLSPRFCQRCDDVIRLLRVLHFGFVNQLFVARKP